ncbi:hypothetical protein H4218_006365, partial [Coemansia sp. IMI 209128]
MRRPVSRRNVGSRPPASRLVLPPLVPRQSQALWQPGSSLLTSLQAMMMRPPVLGTLVSQPPQALRAPVPVRASNVTVVLRVCQPMSTQLPVLRLVMSFQMPALRRPAMLRRLPLPQTMEPVSTAGTAEDVDADVNSAGAMEMSEGQVTGTDDSSREPATSNYEQASIANGLMHETDVVESNSDASAPAEVSASVQPPAPAMSSREDDGGSDIVPPCAPIAPVALDTVVQPGAPAAGGLDNAKAEADDMPTSSVLASEFSGEVAASAQEEPMDESAALAGDAVPTPTSSFDSEQSAASIPAADYERVDEVLSVDTDCSEHAGDDLPSSTGALSSEPSTTSRLPAELASVVGATEDVDAPVAASNNADMTEQLLEQVAGTNESNVVVPGDNEQGGLPLSDKAGGNDSNAGQVDEQTSFVGAAEDIRFDGRPAAFFGAYDSDSDDNSDSDDGQDSDEFSDSGYGSLAEGPKSSVDSDSDIDLLGPLVAALSGFHVSENGQRYGNRQPDNADLSPLAVYPSSGGNGAVASPISTVQHGEPATPPESLTAQPTAPPSTDGEEDTAESSERLAFATEGAVQCEVAMLNKAEHSNMEAAALVVDDSADGREPDELVDASGASTGTSTLADSSDTDGDMQSSDDKISSDVLPQTIESGSGVATTSPLAAQLEEQVSSAGSASVPTGLVVDVFAAWLAEHSVLCNKPRMHGCRGGRGRRRVPPANAEEGPTQEPPVDQPDVPVSPANPAEQPPIDTAEARERADGSKVLSDATLPVASRAGTSSGNSGRSSPTASNASASSQRGSNPGRVDVAMEEGGISIVGAAARAAEADSESAPSQNPVASANVATWARIGPIRQPSVPRSRQQEGRYLY